MKKIFLKSLFFTLLSMGIFSFFSYVFAQTPITTSTLGLEYGAQTGLGSQDIRITIANIIRVALGLLGMVALVIVLWGGFMWMTAGGDENRIVTAKKILLNGVIGLVIILSSYAITSFIIKSLSDATGYEGGGGGSGGSGDIFNPYGGGSYFTIRSRPLGGQLCVANYHPVITFNYPVNLDTVNELENRAARIRILDSNGNLVSGTWSSESGGQAIIFSATGDCGDRGPSDCFEKNTAYTIDFTNADRNIESVNGKKLICQSTQNSEDKCADISFITGDGVDRNPPEITMQDPGSVGKGDSPEIFIEASDDIAVQNISLYVAGNLVGSQSFDGCQKQVSTKIVWPTASLKEGQQYTLVAEGRDQAAQLGTDSLDVRLFPQHCFNTVLDPGEEEVGPPACGDPNICGACPGSVCTYNYQCGGGSLCIDGRCTRVMRILGIDPSSGAPKNFMAIFGENFGTTLGSVWFSKVASPNSLTDQNQWVSSTIVTCGTDTKNWFNNQIVVEVPEGFYPGQEGSSIMVSGNGFVANTIGESSNPLSDIYSNKLRFKYDSALANRPSLCMVNPSQFSSFQNNINYTGKNFGTYTNGADKVYLNISNAEEDKLLMSINTWGSTGVWNSIETQSPRVDDGLVTTAVLAGGKMSNSLRVRLVNTFDKTAPIVDNITPDEGAKGEYVTIVGSNFGSQRGKVRFYEKPVTTLANNNQYFEGSFDFMDECLNDVWSDKKIIVKIPQNAGSVGISPTIGENYVVVVFNSKGQSSILQQGISFYLNNPTPKPGICKIDPKSGPINSGVSIYGENFGNNKEDLKVYFWKNGAVANNFTNRASTTIETLASIRGGQQATCFVPPDAMSGEVVLDRIAGTSNLFSNPLSFEVKDCTKTGQACGSGEKCCSGGKEKGVCRSVDELCLGETRSTGYMWRFTTDDFPRAPEVLTQCDENLDCLENGTPCITPTPAPNIKWGEKTCLNSLVTIGFSTQINAASLAGNVLLYKCSQGPAFGEKFCKEIGNSVSITTPSLGELAESQSLITFSLLGTNNWDSNSFYQVILKNGIKTPDDENGRFQNLKKTSPCDDTTNGLANTAYCFVFETGNNQCILKGVSVTPNTFWTGVLENPIKKRVNPRNLDENTTAILNYNAMGLASQKCTAMNLNGYNFEWSSQRGDYADVPEVSKDSDTAISTTVASALKNTFAVGLQAPTDSLYIYSEVSTSTGGNSLSIIGSSRLTIDLSNPEIIDWGPKCLTACPNADIFIKFDKQMSSNIESQAITLEKCENSNCTATSSIGYYLVDTTGSSLQRMFRITGASLVTNTYYLVRVNSGTLFTIASSTNSSLRGQPYSKSKTWIFGTKDKICEVDRVTVVPSIYNAYNIGERTIFGGLAFSAPDECSSKGQQLNSNLFNWLWTTGNANVAAIQTFTKKGFNPFCDDKCLKRGSTIASSTYNYKVPMCGNGVVEAGEDCEIGKITEVCFGGCWNIFAVEKNPFNSDCTINCLSKTKKTGSCTIDSITKEKNCIYCGDGNVGSEEDCDLGIKNTPPNPLIVSSSLNCSSECLHTGTSLSSKWCKDNYAQFHTGIYKDYKKQFESACINSISQCGNGISEPDEDKDNCAEGVCNDNCLYLNRTKKGSSLENTTPSFCGDKIYDTEEDYNCEVGDFYDFVSSPSTSPWVLAEAVGLSYSSTDVKQTTNITSQARDSSKTGFAQFNLICGYKTDAECQSRAGVGYGVGSNSCCYTKPTIGFPTYPDNEDEGVCPNTEIKISFDSPIDVKTLQGNFLIAREYGSDDSFCTTSNDITSDILSYIDIENMPWYKKIWSVAIDLFQKIFGIEKVTARWCTGEVMGIPNIFYNPQNEEFPFELKFKLTNALKGNTTTYKIVLREGIKDQRGVSIEKEVITFTTWGENSVCKVGSAEVIPVEELFTKINTSTDFVALVKAIENNQQIQPTLGYNWSYVWSKDQSNAFTVDTQSTVNTSNVAPRNQNGDGDVFVTVSTTDPTDKKVIGKSHVTVFLCENPWPPFEVSKKDDTKVWPFDDSANNTDYFDFSYNPEITETGFNGVKNIQDLYSNFSTFYCADSGIIGKNDDLPYMKPVVTSTNESDILKYYLLTNDKNADAIGIKIASNTAYLSLKEWLNYKFPYATFSSLKIDGYEAAVDATGNNVYVAALNVSTSVYSNIYSFSLSAYARTETKNVFDQILTNLKFNYNFNPIYSRKSCAGYWLDTDSGSLCNTDLDCVDPLKPLCINQKEKIQRNYQRLQDARMIKAAIEEYKTKNDNKYPIMVNNTFLANRAFSIWPNSWSEFGSKLGISLPSDPVNKLGSAGTCLKEIGKTCVKDDDCSDINFTDATKIGQWDAENNFLDASVRKVTTTPRGNVTFGPGIGSGSSFSFDGRDNTYLEISSSTNYLNGSFNISFWFKPTEQTPAVLIKQGGWTDDATKNHSLGGFMIEYNKVYFDNSGLAKAGNGTIRFAIFPNSSSDWYYALDFQTPLTLNKWHHVLARYYASDQGMALFVDNQSVGNSFVRKGSPNVSTGVHALVNPADRANEATSADNIIIGQGLKGLMDKIYMYRPAEGVNEVNLYKNVCQLHDPITGWSAEDRRFSFACANGSMAYGYVSEVSNDYVLRMNRENDNLLDIDIWTDVKNAFGLNNAKFIFRPFCESSVISSNDGICGDGIVNVNKQEKCDPPNKILSSNPAPCTTNPTGNYSGVRCASDCMSTSTVSNLSCATFGRCGDGKVQVQLGEQCDDGDGNNGRLGFCGASCQLVADPVCGNGVLDEGEYCDTENNKCIFDGVDVVYDDERRPLFYMLFDESGSMSYSIGGGSSVTRMKKIKDELPEILNKLYGKTRVGAAGFTTYLDPSLTENPNCDILINVTNNSNFDKNTLYQTLNAELQPESGTPTGEALNYVYNNVLKDYQQKNPNSVVNLLLFTDGDTGTDINVTNTVSNLKLKGIKVYILGVGEDKPSFHAWATAANTDFIYIDNNSELDNVISPLIEDQSCQDYSFYNGYSCAWNCKGPGGYCGDNKINGPEQCDLGKDNGLGKGCTVFCTNEVVSGGGAPTVETDCGDGIVQDQEGEECDDSTNNGSICQISPGFQSCSWCSTNCKLRWNVCPVGFVANQSGNCVIQVFRFQYQPIPGL